MQPVPAVLAGSASVQLTVRLPAGADALVPAAPAAVQVLSAPPALAGMQAQFGGMGAPASAVPVEHPGNLRMYLRAAAAALAACEDELAHVLEPAAAATAAAAGPSPASTAMTTAAPAARGRGFGFTAASAATTPGHGFDLSPAELAAGQRLARMRRRGTAPATPEELAAARAAAIRDAALRRCNRWYLRSVYTRSATVAALLAASAPAGGNSSSASAGAVAVEAPLRFLGRGLAPPSTQEADAEAAAAAAAAARRAALGAAPGSASAGGAGTGADKSMAAGASSSRMGIGPGRVPAFFDVAAATAALGARK